MNVEHRTAKPAACTRPIKTIQLKCEMSQSINTREKRPVNSAYCAELCLAGYGAFAMMCSCGHVCRCCVGAIRSCCALLHFFVCRIHCRYRWCAVRIGCELLVPRLLFRGRNGPSLRDVGYRGCHNDMAYSADVSDRFTDDRHASHCIVSVCAGTCINIDCV